MIARAAAASVAIAVVVGLVAACGNAAPAPVVVTVAEAPSASAATKPATSGGPSSSPPQPKPPGPSERAARWQDEEVVTALAADCNWDPDGCLLAASKVSFIRESGQYGDLSMECHAFLPLACVAIPSQSCNPNPCSQEDGCYATCRGGCNDCGAACARSCNACKARCTDDACRLACGRSCATCRGACVDALDHCTSAGCAAEAKCCQRAQRAEYEASTCGAVCPSVKACVDKCPGASDAAANLSWPWYEEACPKGCFQRLGKGCPALWEANCVGNMSRTVQMLSEEELQQLPD